jgi:4-hydroxybenzoyl-CoA reductase subunit beta
MTTVLPALRLDRPREVAEAVAARRGHPGSRFVAGGTDLMVNMRHGIAAPEALIDLSGIEELAAIEIGADGARIGAAVTIAALAREPRIADRYAALAQAAAAIAGPGHRALGTVGGNLCLDTRCIYYNQSEWWRHALGYCLKHRGEVCHVAPQGQRCHAAFTGDLAPALLALGAEVEIAGAQGRRRIPLGELYVEDGRAHLALAGEELVVAVHLPADAPPSAYAKARVRGAIDYPLAGVAVALAARKGAVTSLCIALTGTNSRPFVVAGTEAMIGRPLDETALTEIDRLVQKQVQPMRTTVSSAHYRRLAAAALARRLAAGLYADHPSAASPR